MSRFCSLFSSSSGNCTYIGTAKEGILIDAGVSAKKIREVLSARDIAERSLHIAADICVYTNHNVIVEEI